ncbi:unnamed protein product [Protopolystoma xenopodis]|uniref:Uncharacterized protein n=1 Tax=Protopolystoma xenopodis TaxID=117903 RepID=A0A3S5B3K3_9PLAT|nr:unnamed protein product [Protopolystoma xenopodis]
MTESNDCSSSVIGRMLAPPGSGLVSRSTPTLWATLSSSTSVRDNNSNLLHSELTNSHKQGVFQPSMDGSFYSAAPFRPLHIQSNVPERADSAAPLAGLIVYS